MKFILYRVGYRRRVQRPEVRLQRLLERVRKEFPEIEGKRLVPIPAFEPPHEGLLLCLPEHDDVLVAQVRESLARQVEVREYALTSNPAGRLQPLMAGGPDRPPSPVDSNHHLECGRSFCHIGMYEDAVRHLQQAVLMDPSCFQGYQYLSAIWREKGRFDECIELFEHGLSANDHSSPFHFLLGDLYSEQGRNNEAIRHLKESIRLNPNAAPPYCKLANVLHRTGQHETARLTYEEALSKEPDMAEAAAGLGAVLVEMGRLSEASGWLVKALREDSELTEARLKLGWCYLHMGRGEQAEVEFLTVANGPERGYHTPARFSLGRLYLMQNNPELAIELLEEVCEREPSLAEAHHLLADAYMQTGEPELAVESWRTAIDLDPSREAELRPQMVVALAESGELDVAESEARVCLDETNSAPHMLELLATIHMAREEWEEARVLLLEGERTDPESALIAFQLGWVAENQDLPDVAERYYTRAVRLDPTLSDAYTGLGWIYYERSQFDVALVLLEKALEHADENAELYDSVGWVNLINQNYRESLQHFDRALELEPECAFYRSHRGAALFHLDRLKEAREEVDEALLDDSDPAVHAFCNYLLGLILQAEGRHEQAAAAFAQSRRDDMLPPEFLALTAGGRLTQGSKSEVWHSYRTARSTPRAATGE